MIATGIKGFRKPSALLMLRERTPRYLLIARRLDSTLEIEV